MRLSASLAPRRSLVIGSGTGLIPIFLAATAAPQGQVDAVDLSYRAHDLSSATIPVPDTDRQYLPVDADLRPGYYIAVARRSGIRPDVTIDEFATDSTKFFERKESCWRDVESDGYDLVFVDGAHSYAQAKIDIMRSWSMLRPGGVLVIDDFDKSHVSGLGAVTIAMSPLLDSGVPVFHVGNDDRGEATKVAFAIKCPETLRSKVVSPSQLNAMQAALRRARAFFEREHQRQSGALQE